MIANSAGSKVFEGDGFQYYHIKGFIWPNLIFDTPFHKEKALDTLNRIHEKMNCDAMPNLLICSPPDMPISGLNFLKKHYKKHGYWTAMYMGLDKAIEELCIPNFVINQASQKPAIEEWCELLAYNSKGKEIDQQLFCNMAKHKDCRFYTAYIENKPVATCWAYHYKNSLGLYAITTHPDFCGRGIASEITRHAMRIAKKEQLDAVFLQATTAAISLYHKIGFAQAGQLEVFDLQEKFE